MAEWCAPVGRLDPGFEWFVGANANVDSFGKIDRAPLSATRLIADPGLSPAYGMDHAMADYLETEAAMARSG